jgi:hypothetical protein
MGYSDLKPDIANSRAVLLFGKTADDLQATLRCFRLKPAAYFSNLFLAVHGVTNPADFPNFGADLRRRIDPFAIEIDGIGLRYFELYVCGYLEYLDHGGVRPENIFLLKLKKAILDGRIDKSLNYLLEGERRLSDRIAKKFEDFDNALAGRWNMVPPVILTPNLNGPFTFVFENGRHLKVQNIDGHHRYFLAQLLSVPFVNCVVRDPANEERPVMDHGYRI